MTSANASQRRGEGGYGRGSASRAPRRSAAAGRSPRLGSWALRLLVVVALVGVALVAVPGGVAAQQEITSCQELTDSSEPYILGADITADQAPCFNVQSDGVTLDGNGHTISYSGSGQGIVVQASNVVIRDITVESWQDGVHSYNTQDTTLEGVVARDNTRRGFRVEDSTDLEIVDSTARNNAERGLFIYNSTGTVVRNTAVESNAYDGATQADSGIFAQNGGTVTIADSIVTGNDGFGVLGRSNDFDLTNVSAEANTDEALALDQSSATASNFDVGESTAPGTSLDFVGQSVLIDDTTSPPEAPAGNTSIGRFFDAEPHPNGDPQLDTTLRYSAKDAIVVRESTLDLYYDDGGTWTRVDGAAHDASANTLSATIDSFGTFGAFGEPAPHFNVSIEDATPPVEGETLTVTANVTNRGEDSGTKDVWLEVEGEGETDRVQNVDLAAGDSQVVELNWTPEVGQNETYEAAVRTEDDAARTDVDVKMLPSVQLDAIDWGQPVVEGETLDATATVTNVGDVEGTRTVNLSINRSRGVVDERTVTLGGGESTDVPLSWSTDVGENATYEGTIDTGDDAASASVWVQTPAVFEIDGLSTNSPITEGSDLDVTATVNNTGEATATKTINLSVDGEERASASLQVQGEDSQPVTLTWSTEVGDAGVYDATVATEDATANESVTVGEDSGGFFPPGSEGVFELDVEETNSPVAAGDTVRVTAVVTNPSDLEATETVTLTAAGVQRDAQTVTLQAGETETIVLEWQTTADDGGTHPVSVDSDGDTAYTSVTVRDGSADPTVAVSVEEVTTPVVERQPVAVTVGVEAAATGEHELALESHDGSVVDSETVRLSAGERETVVLTWQTERGDAGSGFVTVRSRDDAAVTSVEIRETPPFSVSVDEVGSPVTAGEALTVRATVSSRADQRRTGYLSLVADGEPRAGTPVTLDPGQSRTVTLTWQTDREDAGAYDGTVDVGSDRESVQLRVRNASSGLFPNAPEFGDSAVDYEPTPQAGHVGVFLWLTLLVGGLGGYVLVTRQTLDARLLAGSLLVAAVRTGTDVLHATVGGITAEPLLALNKILELYVGLLFLAFATVYVRQEATLDDRVTTGLAAVGLTGTFAVATNPLHGLVFTDVTLAEAPFTYVTADSGLLGSAILTITFGSMLLAALLLVYSFLAGTDPALRPVGVLAGGICLAAVVVLLSVLERGPVPNYDYTGAGVAGFLALTATTLFGRGLQRIKTNAQKSLIEDLDDPIVITNDARTVVEYNAAATELLPGIGTGERFDRLVAYSPEWPTAGETTTSEQSRSGLLPARGADRSDGAGESAGSAERSGETHYLVHTTSVTADTGESLGYTVRFTDVTELKRRTNELARKNAQLEQVASTISHDLRNPLSVADGYVDVIRGNVPPAHSDEPVRADDVAEHLPPIRRAVDRMEDIIDDILALARSSDSVDTTEPVEFLDVVEAAWATVSTDQARLFVESTGTVQADRQRLQRILENLFRNSVDHSDGEIAVVAGLTDDGFYVADDGPGIPEEDRDAVFEEGYSSSADGTGLGLAIVTQLAEAHGWEVHLDADYDGARFVFTDCATRPEEQTGPAPGALQHD